jgi:hypothetical protein
MSNNPFNGGGGSGGLQMPKISPHVMLTVLITTVLFIAFIMLTRYVIRRLGGRRRAWRRLRRELVLTGKAFSEPVQTFQRHQREVRVLAEHLGDPRAHLFVRRALSAVQLALAPAPGAYCYAVRVGPYGGEVQLASRRPLTAPEPWQPDENNPLSWYIDPDQWDALPTADGPRSHRPLPVTVGITSEEEDCVVLDFATGPRMVCVEGDGVASQRLLYCLAAQLDGPAGGVRVVMAGGVHAHLAGPRLNTLLDELEDELEPAELGVTGEIVVVCSSPTEEQERRLRALAAAGRIVCLAHGRLTGHCWALRVDSRGRVVAAELGLDADSAALPRAVARSIREGARLAAREAREPRRRAVPAAGNGWPGGGGSGGGDGGGGGTSRRHARSTTRSTTRSAPRRGVQAPAGTTGRATGRATGRLAPDQDTTTELLPPVVPTEPMPDSLAEPAPSQQRTKGASSASR